VCVCVCVYGVLLVCFRFTHEFLIVLSEKADSTLRSSQAVPNPSANRALRRLASRSTEILCIRLVMAVSNSSSRRLLLPQSAHTPANSSCARWIGRKQVSNHETRRGVYAVCAQHCAKPG
jgi:hypothetical protein